jgi:hypothetical protein
MIKKVQGKKLIVAEIIIKKTGKTLIIQNDKFFPYFL